ncbi:amidohydrolase [Aliamphritea hakodatensis]|uniref:amidohydrolase n=1 Tax=Aliamphritea hakodatensis TaxID=2895352 RepID=UPI0022FD4678|nr:amidohydrolase [Aliamphritea hakodatensis]
MSETTKIFVARNILTLNPDCPQATHVAVRDGKILAVGTGQDMSGWDLPIDDRFADKVLMPGFVEAHGHAISGESWRFTYLGFDDQYDPQGQCWPGVENQQQAQARLQAAEALLTDPQTPLIAWHYDPIFWEDQDRLLDRRALDKVSQTRPVMVMHASGHVINVNSALLAMASLDESLDIEGLMKDSAGRLTGELRDLATQFAVLRVVGNPLIGEVDLDILHQYARLATNVGVTTATELYASLDDESLQSYRDAAASDSIPLRFYAAQNAETLSIEQGIERLQLAQRSCNDKLHLGSCKLIVDGSIQSFTARLEWPGYHNQAANGAWKQPPQLMAQMIREYHQAGIQLHIHVNGDQATELVLDILEDVLADSPRADHRHTLQHCQMATEAQYRRMGRLGLCVNLFSNHIYYWGDQHSTLTVGPVRAKRMNAAASALRHGVPLAIHSDAPVTPLNPLFSAWCAVNRTTRSGTVLGEAQKITVPQALHALTLGAAYTLKMDHLVGSIEVGKFADFAVLDDDPLNVPEQQIKDINVWGTVLAGVPHRAAQGVASGD